MALSVGEIGGADLFVVEIIKRRGQVSEPLRGLRGVDAVVLEELHSLRDHLRRGANLTLSDLLPFLVQDGFLEGLQVLLKNPCDQLVESVEGSFGCAAHAVGRKRRWMKAAFQEPMPTSA